MGARRLNDQNIKQLEGGLVYLFIDSEISPGNAQRAHYDRLESVATRMGLKWVWISHWLARAGGIDWTNWVADCWILDVFRVA